MIAQLPVWARYLYQFLVMLSWGGCWLFVLRYSIRYRWWTNYAGQTLITTSACIGSFFTYLLTVSFYPRLPGRPWILLGLFFAITAAILWRVWVFERIAAADRRTRKPSTPQDSHGTS